MDPEKKTGIILIIIGICIPLMALPFLSGSSKGKTFWENFYKVGIQVRKEAPGDQGGQPTAQSEGQQSKASYILSKLTPKRLPFRFFLVFTLILVYMGIVRIDRARKKKMAPLNNSQEIKTKEQE